MPSAESFDLVVIGAGTGATSVARACGGAGWKVAIVDSLPYGGTCALRGCDPKKMLVGATEALDWLRRMNGRGVRASELGIDVRFPACVDAVAARGSVICVDVSTPEGPDSLECDAVVHGAGRVPNLDELQLDVADVEHGPWRRGAAQSPDPCDERRAERQSNQSRHLRLSELRLGPRFNGLDARSGGRE